MRTKRLNVINAGPDGVGLSLDVMNQIINRIEDLVLEAELNKPIAGNNVQINYTSSGAVINAVTA